MAENKDNSGVLEVVAIAALLFFLWWLTRKKVKYIGEPSTTESEVKDEFAADPNFDMNEYCQNVIYRPLSTSELTGSNLLGEGWCYRGDRSAIDETKGFGDAYAEEQAKDYTEMKQEEAILINNKLCVQFRLINSTAAPLTTNVLNVNSDIAPFDPAPQSPVATAASGLLSTGFTANWEAVANASGYYLDLSTDNSFLWMVSGFNNKDVGNVLSYDITGLNEGTIYYYRLRAYNASGSGVNSNIITAITIPDAPAASAATLITMQSFTANWGSTTGATGYYLDVATDAGFTSFLAGFNNKDVGNVIEYDVAGLSQGTDYYYRTRAYNASGTSSSSNTITARTKMLYNDWFLASNNLLVEVYNNIHLFGMGGFVNQGYWTSTEFDATNARYVDFSNGFELAGPKNSFIKSRPCRVFTDIVGAYSLRDTGPAGGLICYVTGTTYYEVSLIDLALQVWSDVAFTAIGTTSMLIAESQNNTNEIIGQVGHTTSAAKLCDDYSIEN